MSECLRYLREAQLRVRSEAYLQAEKRSDDPEADDEAFGARNGQVQGCVSAAAFQCCVHVVLLVTMSNRTGEM
jgi:hypothetical protein